MEKSACLGESITMSTRVDTPISWAEIVPVALAGDAEAERLVRDTLVSPSGWMSLHRYVDEKLWSEPGRSVLAMRRFCRSIGLTDRLHDEVRRSSDPLERALAARTLMLLREEIPLDRLVELLHSEEPSAVVAAAQALALSREPRLFVPVLNAVCGRMPATPTATRQLLGLFGEDVCPTAHNLLKGVLRQYIDAENPVAVCEIDSDCEIDRSAGMALVAVVELLAAYDYAPAAATFTRLLGVSEDDAVRQCLTKVLGAADDVKPSPAVAHRLAA